MSVLAASIPTTTTTTTTPTTPPTPKPTETRQKEPSNPPNHKNAMPAKPTYHLTPPQGHLNDPCGLAYDPSTHLYHLSFQWNPSATTWGTACWGHAVSTDLVSWNTSSTPSLAPSEPYDALGVFTGCMRASATPGDRDGDKGTLTSVYTSVSHLPIHHSLPYVRGCETLSLAVSRDQGRSWRKKGLGNPVVQGPPDGLLVTGWRDPFLCEWHGVVRGELVGLVSGGVRCVADGTGGAGRSSSPTVFVYAVNPRDLSQWRYLGLLVDVADVVGLDSRVSRWSGDLGRNWEVATAVTLRSGSGSGSGSGDTARDFIITSAEGCVGSKEKRQLWVCVKPFQDQTQDYLARYMFSGVFDHGCLYAANSFYDPIMKRQVVYGWITDEDLPDHRRHAQGWSGLVSLPRTVYLVTLDRVKRARSSDLDSITSIETQQEDDHHHEQGHTIRTLGIKPDPRVEILRAKAERHDLNMTRLDSGSSFSVPLRTSRWEIDVEIAVGQRCMTVGLDINGLFCLFFFFFFSFVIWTFC